MYEIVYSTLTHLEKKKSAHYSSLYWALELPVGTKTKEYSRSVVSMSEPNNYRISSLKINLYIT